MENGECGFAVSASNSLENCDTKLQTALGQVAAAGGLSISLVVIDCLCFGNGYCCRVLEPGLGAHCVAR